MEIFDSDQWLLGLSTCVIIAQGYCNFLADSPGSSQPERQTMNNFFNTKGKNYIDRLLDAPFDGRSFLWQKNDSNFWKELAKLLIEYYTQLSQLEYLWYEIYPIFVDN